MTINNTRRAPFSPEGERMDRLFACSLAAALACGASTLLAAEAGGDSSADASAEAADQRTITVTGQRIQYGVRSTSSATKTNTDVKNVPQALTVVTAAQIGDQQLRSIADLLTF